MIQIPPPPPPADLGEIVVTAARLPPAASDAAFSVIRLDPLVLERSQRLDEAVSSVPAVSLFRRTSSLAANPTTQGISLRAVAPSGAGRTLVTLDGVPINDPFGGWVLWSRVSPDALSGLDIVRGAGAGPYGAGALTGVIQLRERDGGGALDASVAEFGGERVSAATGLRQGRFGLTASLLSEVSDGYVPVRGDRAGAADTPLDLEARSGAVRADVALTPAVALSLRASAYSEDRGSGLAGARSRATGQLYSATLARSPGAGRLGYRAQLWASRSDFANSSVAVAAGRGTTTPANDQFATPAEGWGTNLAVRRTAVSLGGGRLEWELGGDARITRGETRERFRFMQGAFTRDRIAGGEAVVFGVYGEGSWSRGPWLVAGGLRLDEWRNTDGRRLETDRTTGQPTLDERDPDRSGEVVTGRLAVRRAIGDDQAVRLAAYSGFRPATLNELHRPFRVGNDLTEANAALEPERLDGIEAGWRLDRTGFGLGVTGFVNRIEDAIVNVTIGQGPATFPRAGFVPAGGVLRQRANAGTIEAAGIEIDGRVALGERLDLVGAVAWTRAEVDGGTAAPQLTGLRPAQAPRLGATAGLDWRASDRLTLSGRARHEGQRFDDDLNSRVLGSATTLDLRADWAVTRAATVYVSADNVTDTRVAVSRTGDDVVGFGPPRTLRLGLRLGW